MATRFEQDCVATVARHLGRAPDLASDDPYESLLARAAAGGAVVVDSRRYQRNSPHRDRERVGPMNSGSQINAYTFDADLESMVEQFFAEKSGTEVVAQAEIGGLPAGLWERGSRTRVTSGRSSRIGWWFRWLAPRRRDCPARGGEARCAAAARRDVPRGQAGNSGRVTRALRNRNGRPGFAARRCAPDRRRFPVGNLSRRAVG